MSIPDIDTAPAGPPATPEHRLPAAIRLASEGNGYSPDEKGLRSALALAWALGHKTRTVSGLIELACQLCPFIATLDPTFVAAVAMAMALPGITGV